LGGIFTIAFWILFLFSVLVRKAFRWCFHFSGRRFHDGRCRCTCREEGEEGEYWEHTRFESISHATYYNGFLYI
jgi:hypothetical protein